MTRRIWLALGSSSALVLFGFQNCAHLGGAPAFQVAAGSSYCLTNAQDASCTQSSKAVCMFNGSTVPEGTAVNAFLNSTVAPSATCLTEKRVCMGGALSGNYPYATCAAGAAPACLFDGRTVPSGSVVTAYLLSNGSCQSQTRSCANGVLSGSYAFASCTATAPASCLFNGQTIAHGQSIAAYASASVAPNQTCSPSVRTCLNGALTGSGDFATCAPSPVACSFNGQTIPSGGAVNAYLASTVPYGQNCSPQARTCTDGILSGAATFASCVVGAPASCQIQGLTITSGSSITLYTTSQGSRAQPCVAEARTCSNGNLSGDAIYGSCAQPPPILGITTRFINNSNTGYATAGFHPRVVANGNGIFLTYETDRDDANVLVTTHVDRSRDGGATFQAFWSKQVNTVASSSLQSDEASNLFVADLNQANQGASVFVFNAYNDFANGPYEIPIPYPSGMVPGSGKFTFLYAGQNRGYFSDKEHLFTIDFSANSARGPTTLIAEPGQTGKHGIPQYPNLTLTSTGRLLFAWTTSLLYTCATSDAGCNVSYLGGNHYLDDHLMISNDGGVSWTNGHANLILPVISDSEDSNTGGAELTRQQDVQAALAVQGDNFLESILTVGDSAHFVYNNGQDGGTAVYGRFGLAGGLIDRNPSPVSGPSIRLNSNGMFFASAPGLPLYLVGATDNGNGTGNIAALVSRDNGLTWDDYALDSSGAANIQYISGSPTLTSDNFIVGEYTVQNSDGSNEIHFLRIPAR